MGKYRIQELAQQYTEYDLIETHTKLPPYPEQRTRLLYAFLNGGMRGSEQSELYALATSLAQLGLDTHDHVDPPPVVPTGQARWRQLNVLAGDYFNSRFYQLLSQAERIDVVRLVSITTLKGSADSSKPAGSELAHAMSVKTNDQLMTIYLSSLIRAITAYHDLIDNKIQNLQQQEEKEAKKEELANGSKDEKKDGAAKAANGDGKESSDKDKEASEKKK